MTENIATVLPTEREFLVAKGLAQPTRGRFSKDAVAALVEARAQGQEFRSSKPVVAPKAPKVVVTQAQVQAAISTPKAAAVEVNPKEVRAWAKANGHEVGDRGRLHGSLVTAFLASGGKPVGERATRPTPLDMPKVRTQTVAWALVQPRKTDGAWVTPFVLGVEKCGRGHNIQTCNCVVMTTNKTFGNTPLVLVKPIV